MPAHIATSRSFARNLLSGWVTLVVEVVIAFTLTPFVVLHLGVAAYGIWSLAVSVVGYLGLIDLGIRGSVGRYINHYLAREDWKALDEVIGTAISMLLALGAVAVLGSVLVALNFEAIFPKTPAALAEDMGIVLPLLALGVIFAFLNAILGNMLAAREKLYVNNGLAILVAIARALATVGALTSGGGLLGLAAVTLGVSALQFLALMVSVRKTYRDRELKWFTFSTVRLRELATFGTAAFATRAFSMATVDAGPLIGMWTLGPEAVGVYSLALTLIQNGKRLIDQAGAAIYPSVVKAAAVQDLANLRRLYLRYLRVTLSIGGLVFTGLAVFGGDFLALWVGANYARGGSAVAVLAAGYLLAQFASTSTITLQSLDKVGITFWIGLAEATAAVCLMLLLSGPLELGIAGIALATALPPTVSATVVYPLIVGRLLGSELTTGLRREAVRAAVVLTSAAVVFEVVRAGIPKGSWAGFATAVSVATLFYAPLGAWLAGLRFSALVGGAQAVVAKIRGATR